MRIVVLSMLSVVFLVGCTDADRPGGVAPKQGDADRPAGQVAPNGTKSNGATPGGATPMTTTPSGTSATPSGTSPTTTGGAAPADRWASDIRKRVSDANLSQEAQAIRISANNGRVALEGQVRNNDERLRIVEIAGEVAGPGKVDNRLTIADETPKTTPDPK